MKFIKTATIALLLCSMSTTISASFDTTTVEIKNNSMFNPIKVILSSNPQGVLIPTDGQTRYFKVSKGERLLAVMPKVPAPGPQGQYKRFEKEEDVPDSPETLTVFTFVANGTIKHLIVELSEGFCSIGKCKAVSHEGTMCQGLDVNSAGVYEGSTKYDACGFPI